MANNRVFSDKDGDIWIEHPPGSGQMLSFEAKVLDRQIQRHKPLAFADAVDDYGPLLEMT